MNYIVDFFSSKPERIRFIGGFICYAAAAVLAVGVLVFIKNILINTSPLANMSPSEHSIPSPFPNIPTFWIPESFEGFAVTVCLLILGLCFVFIANSIERQLRY